jgi:spore coat protein U-like protein
VNKRILVLGLLLAGSSAHAITTCRLVSGGGLAFGAYDTITATPTDSALTVIVRCDRRGGPQNVAVSLEIGAGVNGTTTSARRMLHGGGSGTYLAYGLFRDVGRSANWGTMPGVDTMTQVISVPNNGSASGTFTIYGRIPALQNPRAGSYADSVQITLTP